MPNSTTSADWRDEKIPDGRRVGKFPADDDPRQIAAIVRGLDLLLTACIQARANPPACPDWVRLLQDDFHGVARQGGALLFGKGAAAGAHRLSRESAAAFDLLGADPLQSLLRRGVRQLGQRLYALTKSNQVMLDACWNVAALDPSNEEQRLAIMSSAWDGIGSWAS